ncbi:MAG: hypothetical protein HY754_06950 [Nitrospirae bacterium]|nr:hypothetical protein [Nitrospirota bacterium]
MATVIPIEIFELLEKKVGREEAKEVIKVIEASLDAVEKKAEAVALQKKLEIKDELTKELATKADIARLEGEIHTVRAELEGRISTLRMEFRVYFVILLAVIILVRPKAIDLIGKFLGVIK